MVEEPSEASVGARTQTASSADDLEALLELAGTGSALPLTEVEANSAARCRTGLGEFDRVLGGGLVPGSSVLLGGDPGIGKSTLALQAASNVAVGGRNALLVTAEESTDQIRLRADRLGPIPSRCYVSAEDSVAGICATIRELAPALVIVDSIQTVRDPRLESAPGTVAQVRESAASLARMASSVSSAIVLVGHVTKDGALAGPRVLEHLVDVVLAFEGERRNGLRSLRAVKNRFGPVGEIGLFEMTNSGLDAVADASALLLAGHGAPKNGSAVACTMEGRRPLLVEIQALVGLESRGTPRRSVSGFDHNRVNVLCGVLTKRAAASVLPADTFVSVAGGMRVSDPACDLALCVALASSKRSKDVPPGTVWFGEVGLGGEVRGVGSIQERVREVCRYGFETLVVAASDAEAAVEAVGSVPVTRTRVDVVGVGELAEAVRLLG